MSRDGWNPIIDDPLGFVGLHRPSVYFPYEFGRAGADFYPGLTSFATKRRNKSALIALPFLAFTLFDHFVLHDNLLSVHNVPVDILTATIGIHQSLRSILYNQVKARAERDGLVDTPDRRYTY